MNEKQTPFDVLVVGAGLCGAVAARSFAERGLRVAVWDRRDHIGGNMFDYTDAHGILVQKYGPHTFHTNDPALYDYMCRFGEWTPYKLTCGAVIDGVCTPTPFNFTTVDDFYAPEAAAELKRRIAEQFAGRSTATVLEVLRCPDPVVRGYAEFLFAKDYSLYTAKQWAVSPSEIDPIVLERVPLRFSYDVGYFDDVWQVMPEQSYAAWFENLLSHENITVSLGVEALSRLSIRGERLHLDGEALHAPVLYSGAIDELFACCLGRLPYRSLRFEWAYQPIDSLQGMPVVAYPQAADFTRITEYKKLPVQQVAGTSYAVEYPLPYAPEQGAEPYYPVLTESSRALYESYRRMAERVPGLYPCGRLADFKYYNMDAALRRVLDRIETIEV